MIKKGYGPHVYEYDVIGEIDWKEINVPNTEVSEPFPDVTRRTRFGMVLHSELTITHDACYEFTLNSDDGSLLWIDKNLIVNNSGDHEMTSVTDTTQLKAGKHKAKIWYHQAFPVSFGFIFKYDYSGPFDSCPKNEAPKEKSEIITISSSILFGHNCWDLSDNTNEEMEKLVNVIKSRDGERISTVSYTHLTLPTTPYV